MAKRKPTLTILEMENALGYKLDPSLGFDKIGHRFYSDLMPVSGNIYDRTEREYLTSQRKESSQFHGEDANALLPTCNEVKTIAWDGDSILIRRTAFVGLYKFFVDIEHGFGLSMPLLYTEAEALSIVSVAQLQPRTARASIRLLNLPRELREKVYGFVLHGGKCFAGGRDGSHHSNFCRAIGDPSGLYFPIGKDLTLLRVNRQMRQEALPVAYRNTTFDMADIDDLTQLLIAVGRIGRENIESLEFSWESRIDCERNWRKFPESEDNHLILPALHVSACVQLLKQCRRLRLLRIKFEGYLMTDIPKETFTSDPGILLLCSLRGIERVEILGSDGESLDGIARWLRDEMAKETGSERQKTPRLE